MTREKQLLFVLVAILGVATAVNAQENNLTISTDIRTDYRHVTLDSHKIESASGFKNKVLSVMVDGDIMNGKFYYCLRQRLNKPIKDNEWMDATDKIYIGYNINDNWAIELGKHTVSYGTFDYDPAPVNTFFTMEYIQNFNCYQFGGMLKYTTNDKKDLFALHITQCPFWNTTGEKKDIYAYNLKWIGEHGWFSSIYTLNCWAIDTAHYMYMAALGNKFAVGNTDFILDLSERYSPKDISGHTDKKGLNSFSMSALAEHHFNNGIDLRFGWIYDYNKDNWSDYCVLPGTNLKTFELLLKYIPKIKQKIRLHAGCTYSYGSNSNPNGAYLPKMLGINVGATWTIDVLNRKFK